MKRTTLLVAMALIFVEGITGLSLQAVLAGRYQAREVSRGANLESDRRFFK